MNRGLGDNGERRVRAGVPALGGRERRNRLRQEAPADDGTRPPTGTDFEQVTIRELAIDILRAVDLGLELGIYAYDAYILEAARSSGFPLLALDGPIRRNAKKLGLSVVEVDV